MRKRIIAILTALTIAAGFCLPAMAASPTVAGDIVLVDEDFSDGFTLNQAYTGAQMEALSDLKFVSSIPTGFYPDTTSSYLSVKKIDENDSSKGNYLEIGNHADNKHAIVMADFDDVEAGTIVQEMRIRVYAGYRTKNFNALLGSDNSVKNTLLATNAGNDATKIWPGGIFPKWGKVFSTDEDGFISVKTVWSRANATDNWAVDIYDVLADTKLYSYTGTGTDQTVDSSFVPSGAMFVNAFKDPSWSDVPIDLADLKVFIPAEVTFTQDAAYDSMEKVLSYTASENLDETTINTTNIKVTGPNGQDVAVNPSWNSQQRKISLTFPYGLPENGDYTVSFANVKTARGFNVNKSAVFSGQKTVMPLEVASVSPEEGTIPDTIGEIEIVFSHEIDESTVSAISFTKANGDPINGYSEITVDRKTAKITFGTLSVGDYLLTIGTGVKMKDEDQYLASERIYHFTAEEKIDLVEDFSSDSYVTDRVYTADELNAINEGIIYDSDGTYKVEEIDGKKVITMSPTAISSGPALALQIADKLAVGTFEVDFRMKRSDSAMFANLFNVASSENQHIMTLEARTGGTSLGLSSNSAKIGGTLKGTPTTDEQGFMCLKTIISRRKTQDAWDYKLIDTLTNAEIYTVEIPADKLADIKKFTIASVYTLSDAEVSGYISITDISIKLKRFAKVLTSDCESALPTVQNISFLINSDVNPENIKATIYDKNDETVAIPTTVNYVESDRKIELSLLSYLDYGTDYVVSFENADISDYEFTTAEAPLLVESKTISYYDAGGTLINELPEDDAYKAVYDVSIANQGGETRNLLIGLLSYNANGKVYSKSIKLVNSSSNTITDSVYLEGLTKAEVKEVKCFIWELTSTGYEPVAQ